MTSCVLTLSERDDTTVHCVEFSPTVDRYCHFIFLFCFLVQSFQDGVGYDVEHI